MPRDPEHLRDELISKVQVGKISPEVAEAQAKEVGLPPFASRPDLSLFDPLKVSRWTFPMAIAWIAWRDLALVTEQQKEFREECTDWFFREWNQPADDGKSFNRRQGWFLESLPTTNALTLLLEHEYLRSSDELPLTFEFSPTDAENELLRALADDEVKAEGFNRDGDLVEIPAREWTRLQRFEERERDVFKYRPLDPSPPYTDVLFRRDDLLRRWPKAGSRARSEVECRRWLISVMRESLMHRPGPKAEFRIKAMKQFVGLSLQQFNRAWDRAIEETGAAQWKKPGRPPKKSNQHAN